MLAYKINYRPKTYGKYFDILRHNKRTNTIFLTSDVIPLGIEGKKTTHKK
jgi:hypothetical protein